MKQNLLCIDDRSHLSYKSGELRQVRLGSYVYMIIFCASTILNSTDCRKLPRYEKLHYDLSCGEVGI